MHILLKEICLPQQTTTTTIPQEIANAMKQSNVRHQTGDLQSKIKG
jgi:hypothetical protein